MDFFLSSSIATLHNYYANENQRYVVKTLAKMFHNIKNQRNLYSHWSCFFVLLMTYLHCCWFMEPSMNSNFRFATHIRADSMISPLLYIWRRAFLFAFLCMIGRLHKLSAAFLNNYADSVGSEYRFGVALELTSSRFSNIHQTKLIFHRILLLHRP